MEAAPRAVPRRPDGPADDNPAADRIAPQDGWCDDPSHAAYNRQVTLPFGHSHETLWRADGLYDLIVVLGHNDDPPAPGLGSAIFLHVAAPDYTPTEGCVALALGDLLEVVTGCTAESAIDIRQA